MGLDFHFITFLLGMSMKSIEEPEDSSLLVSIATGSVTYVFMFVNNIEIPP